jgi:hypothetical protein
MGVVGVNTQCFTVHSVAVDNVPMNENHKDPLSDNEPWVSWSSSSEVPYQDPDPSLWVPSTSGSQSDWGKCQSSSSSIILLEVSSNTRSENAPTDQSLDHEDNPESTTVVTKTFELLEPLHLELGVGGKVRHVIDYAYSPVVGFGSSFRMERGAAAAAASTLDQNALIPTRNNAADHDTATCAADAPRTTSREHFMNYPKTRAAAATVTVETRPSSTRLSWLLGNPWFWWQWWIPWAFWQRQRNLHCSTKYQLQHEAFAGGSHGQVWKGRLRRRSADHRRQDRGSHGKDYKNRRVGPEPLLIFKLLRVDRGFRTLEAGLREVYFGQRILTMQQNTSTSTNESEPTISSTEHNGTVSPKLLFTEYVEHFFGESDGELWIVFRDAGPSLRAILYAGTDTGDYVVYQHSWLWTLMRMSLKEAATQGHSTRHKQHAESSTDTVKEHPIVSSTAAHESTSVQGNHENQPPVVNASFGSALIKDLLRQVRVACVIVCSFGSTRGFQVDSYFVAGTTLDIDGGQSTARTRNCASRHQTGQHYVPNQRGFGKIASVAMLGPGRVIHASRLRSGRLFQRVGRLHTGQLVHAGTVSIGTN